MNSREVKLRFGDGREKVARINTAGSPRVVAFGLHFFVQEQDGVYSECTICHARDDNGPIQPPANAPWVGKALQTREG